MIKRCKNCGGNLFFEPKSKGCVCENCSSVFPVEYNERFEKKPFSESENLKKDELAESLKSVRCESCGAQVLLSKYHVQSSCPYCGNTALFETESKKMMYIDSVIPFSFGKAEALSKFKANVRKRFYANKTIFRNVTPEDIRGAYINTFVFDINTHTTYSGVLTYTETVSDGKGGRKTVTRMKPVSGSIDKMFNNITVESNANFTQAELNQISPYNYSQAVDFKGEFSLGYMIEYQDTVFNDCVKVANRIIESKLKKEIIRQHHCETAVSLTLNTQYSDQQYNYCLLPVYFVSKKIKDKKYKALMNGQTGKVGDLPSDKVKVFFTVLLALAFIVFVVIMAFKLS